MLILISAIQRMLFQIWAGFLKICFLAKSKHALFASCGEPSVFVLDSILLIIDFDSVTSTSWRVFFTWLDIVKGFFFPMERFSDHLPMLSSVDVHAFLYCYVMFMSPVHSLFSECTKLLIWPFQMFLLSL